MSLNFAYFIYVNLKISSNIEYGYINNFSTIEKS